jgi:hypothetical protein
MRAACAPSSAGRPGCPAISRCAWRWPRVTRGPPTCSWNATTLTCPPARNAVSDVLIVHLEHVVLRFCVAPGLVPSAYITNGGGGGGAAMAQPSWSTSGSLWRRRTGRRCGPPRGPPAPASTRARPGWHEPILRGPARRWGRRSGAGCGPVRGVLDGSASAICWHRTARPGPTSLLPGDSECPRGCLRGDTIHTHTASARMTGPCACHRVSRRGSGKPRLV